LRTAYLEAEKIEWFPFWGRLTIRVNNCEIATPPIKQSNCAHRAVSVTAPLYLARFYQSLSLINLLSLVAWQEPGIHHVVLPAQRDPQRGLDAAWHLPLLHGHRGSVCLRRIPADLRLHPAVDVPEVCHPDNGSHANLQVPIVRPAALPFTPASGFGSIAILDECPYLSG